MNSSAMNRVDGVMKAVSGFGLMAGAACFMMLGWWIALPLGVWGGMRFGAGIAQAATGWTDDAE